jgi:hypothetical protein
MIDLVVVNNLWLRIMNMQTSARVRKTCYCRESLRQQLPQAVLMLLPKNKMLNCLFFKIGVGTVILKQFNKLFQIKYWVKSWMLRFIGTIRF